MATNTTNYSLTKPAYTDTADIADINGNMDTVDSALTKLCNDLAIVEFGNNSTHSISNGSFVVWKGDLYVANQNISNGAALSGKLTAVANGGLNNLNNLYDTLNSNIATIGGGSKSWIVNAELNDYKTTGTYAISTGATADGVSTGIVYFLLIVIAPRTDTVYQILESQNVVLVRECRNNVWSGLYNLLTSKSNYVEYTNVTVDFDSIPLNTVAKIATSSASHCPVGTSFYGTVETVCGNPTATDANRYALQKAYKVEGTGVINTYMRAYFNSEWHTWNAT